MKVRWRRKTLRVFLFGVFLRSCLVESLVNRLLTPTSRLLPTFVPCYSRLLTYQFLARQVIATPIADAINPRRHQYVGNLPHWPMQQRCGRSLQPALLRCWASNFYAVAMPFCLSVRSFVCRLIRGLTASTAARPRIRRQTNERTDKQKGIATA